MEIHGVFCTKEEKHSNIGRTVWEKDDCDYFKLECLNEDPSAPENIVRSHMNMWRMIQPTGKAVRNWSGS